MKRLVSASIVVLVFGIASGVATHALGAGAGKHQNSRSPTDGRAEERKAEREKRKAERDDRAGKSENSPESAPAKPADQKKEP